MRILILEDDANRIEVFRSKLIGHELTIVETAGDCLVKLVNDYLGFDLIFLDHDLGGNQMVSSKEDNTGSTVVRYLVQRNALCPLVIVHSLNTSEAKGYMIPQLERAGITCKYIPFTALVNKLDTICQNA